MTKTDDRDKKIEVAGQKFGAATEGNKKGRPGKVALWSCGLECVGQLEGRSPVSLDEHSSNQVNI